MREIAGYINSYIVNSEPGWLYKTRPWYLNTTCLRHTINEKDLFIRKLQLNTTKLEYANKKIFTSKKIGSICFFCIDKNKNPLTTSVDNVLYSL